jgi:transposase InsO family protein
LSRQVTEAFPWDTAPRYLLRDRDASYGAEFRKRVAAMDITEVITARRSPWQNAYVEWVIGSIRRECLDYLVIVNARHLRRVLSLYLDYYVRLARSDLQRLRKFGCVEQKALILDTGVALPHNISLPPKSRRCPKKTA